MTAESATPTIDLTSAVSKATTGTGAAIAAVGGLTLTEWMGVLGVVIAIIGAIANTMHNRTLRRLAEREDARQQEEHEMKKEEHRARIDMLLRERRIEDHPTHFDRRADDKKPDKDTV